MLRSGCKRTDERDVRRYIHKDSFWSKAIVLVAVTFIENAKETRCLRTILRLAVNSYTSCRERSSLAASRNFLIQCSIGVFDIFFNNEIERHLLRAPIKIDDIPKQYIFLFCWKEMFIIYFLRYIYILSVHSQRYQRKIFIN